MVESSRRHGPFDTRYPLRPRLAAITWELQPGEERLERLDWSAFLARFYPNRRRHDLEALAAYQSYRNALEQASAAADTLTRPASTPGTAAASELSAAVLVWEWEGGTVTEQVAG
jgi:hypothetical protein